MNTTGYLWTTHRTPIKVQPCSISSGYKHGIQNIFVSFTKQNFIDYSDDFYISVSFCDKFIPSLVIGLTNEIYKLSNFANTEICVTHLTEIVSLDKLDKIFMAYGGREYKKWFR